MDNNNVRNSAVNITRGNGDVKTSLPPSDIHRLDTTIRDDVALSTLALAPSLEKDVVCTLDHTGLAVYADAQHYLLRLIHIDVLRSWISKRAFCILDRSLSVTTDHL